MTPELPAISCSLLLTDARVGSVALRQCRGYVIALGTRFAFLDWDTQVVTTILELEQDKPNNRFNDGKVDPKGRFFAGKFLAQISPRVKRNYLQCSVYSLVYSTFSVPLSSPQNSPPRA